MPRSVAANALLREQRRAQILAAAAPVFARKGFAGTTVADLAAAAAMSLGLLYRYFADKDAVFTELVAQTVQHSIELAEQALVQPGTPWERLHWFVATFLPTQYAQPEFALVISHALTSEAVPEAAQTLALEHTMHLIHVVRELIITGQSSGDVVVWDAGQLALHLLATLHGLAAGAAFYRASALHFPTPEVVLRGLRAEPADRARDSGHT